MTRALTRLCTVCVWHARLGKVVLDRLLADLEAPKAKKKGALRHQQPSCHGQLLKCAATGAERLCCSAAE